MQTAPPTEATHGSNWIETYTGRQVWPLSAAGDIDLEDIAHSLAMTCRFGGHTRLFYSVAQHCVLASEIIAPEFALWGLMHDAAEAYLGDITRPIKSSLYAERHDRRTLKPFAKFEEELLQAIAARFFLPWPAPWEAIEQVDLLLLASERLALLNPGDAWPSIAEYIGREITINAWEPEYAKAKFKARAIELGLI